MRSALPKVLHPICGRPMILWPLLAARAAGAERVIVVDNPKRRLAEHLPGDVEVAIQEQPRGTGDAVAAAAGLARPRRARARHQRRHAADHRRGDRRARRGARGGGRRRRRSRRWSSTTPRATAASSAAPTGASSASSRRRPRATPRPRSSRSARSTPASTCSTAARCSRRWPSSTATTPRASSTSPTCCRCCSPPAGPSRRYPLADPDLALGVNDRVDLAHVTAARAGAHPPRPPARRGHDRGPGEHADRGRRRRSAATRRSSRRTFLRGAHAGSASGCTVGPLTTLIDSELADGVTVRHPTSRARPPPTASTIGPFAYLRPQAVLRENAKAGTFVEIKNSTVGAGSKVPHLSYVGDADVGEGSNIGAGHDHRQLRRPRQAPHDDRGPRARLRRHRASSRP